MELLGLDHVQLAMPSGEEERARAFFSGVLGMVEEPKPEVLRANGGCWFRGGPVSIHVGVDPEFRPAKKAHPALVVADLDGLSERLVAAGRPVKPGEPLPGMRRAFTEDPFGNRIELVERDADAGRPGR